MRYATLLMCALLVSPPSARGQPDHGEPPVRAPFERIDTLATNDWWNRPASKILDVRAPRDQVVAFGIYTVADGVLKLSAQLYPLYPDESRTVRLELFRDGRWHEVARQDVNDIGWSTTFRVEGWDATRDVPYRLRHGDAAQFEGRVRRDPSEKEQIVLAALSCNSNKDRGGRARMVDNLIHHDPDVLFFAGDQSYDHREHTAAWLACGLQFRDVFRDRPCVTIPDDHDVGQPNLWGEGGKRARLPGAADGGYLLHPEYVKMVERQQTAHLPDPIDPTPVGQGIGVYYTRLIVGGVDFAIIEDRKFKSGPAGKIPQQGPRPDHVRNPEYDPASIDLPGLELLGGRQLGFLDRWAEQRDGVALKAVLSQTGFCGAAHIHGAEDNRLHADLDSNGWPQAGRNQALRLIRKAGAVHIGGDQHLATVVQHGVDEFRDGPWAFVVPAIVNNYYSRWWKPEDERPGGAHNPNSPLPWTGDYLDGFGNKITMHAYANPDTPSFGGGYGLVRFNKPAQTVTFECWPRGADVTAPDARQFVGWPITVDLKQADPAP
ncbi:hypothetical protein KOR34_33890 [Posidoniimonas corsicana]|uniref:PhoD-like phosphatase n=1 Tax=Posidoniimonas corsicana TaxID=1938618 RepID=A0A5C5V6X6_9BACT|nr:hypothetical protein [Posidoniimonas corsicana]TWT33557.1 hypothetical protein KOR34_33890 [Posidoniimonas corsicana]